MSHEAGRVRRFDLQYGDIWEEAGGQYVLHADYEASEWRVRELESTIKHLLGTLDYAVGHGQRHWQDGFPAAQAVGNFAAALSARAGEKSNV